MAFRRPRRVVHALIVLILFSECVAFRLSRDSASRRPTRLSAAGPKFSQPAFPRRRKQDDSSVPDPPKYGSDSAIGSAHTQRVKTAGRVGTKRFVDPCKVFLGNLPFHVDEPGLSDWVCQQMGLPPTVLLHDCKVIRDWKTGKSKGYGFVVFTEAMYGTVCIDKCHNQELGGRKLTVNQGQKKQDPTIYVKKKKAPAADADEEAIQAGIAESMDPLEAAMLRRLDPDLVDDAMDEVLFEDLDGDDDDDGVDGFWEGDDGEVEDFEDTQGMNREQRREAARRQKRRKLPHKGFGTPAS